ncbi:unnamed protein product [Caenorhabditis bovis]|uniref:Uncharacterized protein n=1 Tax=Caenorhabditis bovis TaxID=2654633 RepID=A0A8S1EPT5_9PELO|nr:unnamed protein product [Caenorhabditis bovis]
MPKTSVWKTRVGTQILMGKITDITQIGIDRIPCAHVRCQMNEFNIYLKKYFARSFDFWALDRTSVGSIGDTVLIKRIDGSERPKANVSHTVDRVIFKFGNIIDPVTGRKIFKDQFSDEIDLKKIMIEKVVDEPFAEESLLFEEKRALQIRKLEEEKASLLKAIDNETLVAGEVTKGPRTAAQRLPRHMRRRAMAYEVRRFPRGMREFAAAHIVSKHRKKPPSRFARRKASNILKSYVRRQMTNGKWLETHIWHAKRFRIVQKWGFKIADRSYQRGYRSILRDANSHCAIRDHSYLTCIIISGSDEQKIIENLNKLCNSKCGSTFASKHALTGKFECSIQLFRPNQYPKGFIGPARFQWLVEESASESKICLWVHPSVNSEVFEILKDVFEVEKKEFTTKEEEESIELLESPQNINIQIIASSFNRFRLYGPLALRKLSSAIILSDDTRFEKHHKTWKTVVNCQRSLEMLMPGTVFSLSIEDPRISFHRKKIGSAKCGINSFPEEFDLEQPCTSIYDAEERKKARNNRLSSADFEKQQSEKIEGLKTTPAKIPCLVIFRNSNQGVLDGIEILIPQSFGKDFWVSLQRQGVRASGLRDDISGHLEARKLCFPNDSLDSKAGQTHESEMMAEIMKKYNARPHNRRTKFWSALSIKYPFDFHFNELVANWNGDNASEAVICRDYQILKHFDAILKGEKSEFDVDRKNLLIPVRIDFIARGRPKRFAIICAPNEFETEKATFGQKLTF